MRQWGERGSWGGEASWGEESTSMSEEPARAGGSTSMAESWGESTSMVDAAGGWTRRVAGGLGSSQEALTTLAMGARVAVVPRLNGGDFDFTMGGASGACGNQRLRHWAACAERSSKQKGRGEGKEGKEEGFISGF